jgi:hypothetical protein
MDSRRVPAPWERVYDIHGIRVAVRADSAAVAAGADRALSDFAALSARATGKAGRAARPVEIELHDVGTPRPLPEGAQPQFRHARVRCYRHQGELWFTDPAATVVLDPEAGRAEGHVAPSGDPSRLRDDPIFTFPLLELLRHRGLFHVHAAGLARGERGVLLPGDTGAGKSTLTVTLIRAGWDYLSDDALLLRAGPTGVEALAVPDEFHLDPALGERFPELAGLAEREPYSAGRRRAFRPEEVYARSPVPACMPSVLLFPQISPGGTRAEAMAPSQALTALIRVSALVLLDERVAASHLDALRRLVSQCRCYRLYHGPDALADPERVSRLVEQLLNVARF